MTLKKLLPEDEEEYMGYLMDDYDNYKRYMTRIYYAQRPKTTNEGTKK